MGATSSITSTNTATLSDGCVVISSSTNSPTNENNNNDLLLRESQNDFESSPMIDINFTPSISSIGKSSPVPLSKSSSTLVSSSTIESKTSSNKKTSNMKTATTSNKKIPLRQRQASPCFPRRIHTENWDTKPPCAVIVTIYTESSYDDLFRAVPQQSPNPDYSVALFEMDHETIPVIMNYLQHRDDDNMSRNPAFQQVMDAIAQVEPSSVVFNFECCDHCSDNGFACNSNHQQQSNNSIVMPFVRRLIDAGYMVMFGDFSLKALIHDWDAALLGPNPFQSLSTCNFSMSLAFDSQQLLACPSGQLQSLGRLNDGISSVEMHCLTGTITCTLKEESEYTVNNDMYTLEVLTIATKVDQFEANPDAKLEPEIREALKKTRTRRLLKIGNKEGYLGHALLKYRSGGSILVSSGHWIELTRVEANEDRLIEELNVRYGRTYSQQVAEELASLGNNKSERMRMVSMNASQLIQSASPALYSCNLRSKTM